MEDLITWLRACLDDDEQAAKAATPGPWAPSGNSVITADDIEIADVPRRDASHIARHDPAAILADVEAKRAILELHAETGMGDCAHSSDPCPTLRVLARAYRHRAGWRTEWVWQGARPVQEG